MARAAKTGNSAVLLPVPSSRAAAAAGRKQGTSTAADGEGQTAKRPRRQMVRLYADVSSPEGQATPVLKNKASAAQNAPVSQRPISVDVDHADDIDFQPKRKKSKGDKPVLESVASSARGSKRKAVSTRRNMTDSKLSQGQTKAGGPASLQSFSFDGIKRKQGNGDANCTEVIDLASPVATRTHAGLHTNNTYTGMY